MPRPYTYLLINSDETSWYIGVRCANKVPAEQDIGYMSSSKYVKARIKAGEVFTKHILGEYETNEEAYEAEDLYLRAHWDVPGRINKALGFKYEFDDEVRAKMSASAKAAFASPEVRAKMSASAKAALASPEVRAKISDATKAAYTRPEVKAKHSAAVKAAHARPEVKAKHSASAKASNARPEVKAKQSASAKASNARPEVKAKQSAATKAALARPEVKAKHSAATKAAFARPEVKAKQSASAKAAHARPEVKAKICKICTIDGITIYSSLKKLVAELGKGKNGSRHPNFRYVQKT